MAHIVVLIQRQVAAFSRFFNLKKRIEGMPYWRGKSILHLGVRWIMLATAVQFAFYAHPLFANPAGASVVNGAVNMQTSGNTLAITASDRSIINWQGFSIGAGETTQFIQPNAGASVLNRVTSGDASQIMGALQANGQVYLINPNGVFIGNGATINVGSFLASTANVSDESFKRGGNLTFSEASGAGIINRGTITANHGDVFLLAKTVENSGTIQAAQGTVGLMAGTQFFLKKDETGAVKVKVDSSSVAGMKAGTGVANSGVIEAMQAQLEAQGNVYALAINQSGIIRATGVSRDASGTIVLSAPGGMIRNTGTMLALNRDGSGGRLSVSGGDILTDVSSIMTASGTGVSDFAMGGQIEISAEKDAIVSGRLDVSAGDGAKGGRLVVTGERVGLSSGKVNASGGTGGGEVLLGGDYQGVNPLVRNADAMVMTSDSSITADATVAGDGGKVILWSNEYTGFYGNISANGGAVSGNGGFVETSSKENLQAFGIVTASANKGEGGLWLMDPANVEIATSTSNGSFNSGSPNTFTPSGNGATASATTINASLSTGTSVTINTEGAGTENGNITMTAPISMTGGANATLTMNAGTTGPAGGTITISQAITSSAGNNLNVILNATGTGGAVVLSANITTQSGALTINSNTSIQQSTGVLTIGGTTTLAAGSGQAINLSTGGTPNNFGAVVVTSGGAVTLSEADTITFGAVTASGNFNLVSGGAATFNNAVNLGQTGGSFNATITGAANVNNTITANGVTISPTGVLTIGPLGTITSGGAVALGGSSISTGANVTTTADAVTYLANTTLTAPGIVVNSAGGDITFSGTLLGAQSLGLTAGAGNILFSGAVGGGTPLTTVTINSANNVTASGAFSAASLSLPALTGSAIFNGNLNLTTGLTTTAGAYAISMTGANNTIAGITFFNNTGTLTLGDGGLPTADALAFTGGVTAIAPSSKAINGTITAAGTGVINLGTTSVTVGGTTTVGGTSTGAITLGNATLANGVTLTVGTGIANAITLGSVTGTASGAVSNLTVTSTGAVILNGAIGTNIGAVSVSSNPSSLNVNSTITGSGAIALTAGAGGITTATYSVTDATISSTASSVSLTTSSGGNINLNSPIDTIGGTTVALNSAGILIIGVDGDITSDGNVGLTGTSGIQTSGSVATSADAVTFSSATTLTGTLNVNTGSTGGNITFSSTVTGAGQNLNLTAGTAGNVVFTGAVGAARLGAITINSANDVTAAAITAASLVQTTGQGTTTFSGVQNYNTATGLNVVTDTIALNQAVNTTAGGIVTLNANDLGGAVAGTLTIGASGIINSAGAVTLTGATGLTQNAAVTTSDGGVVTIDAGTGTLTIAAAGDITSGGAVNLTATSGISTAGNVTTNGNLVNYNSATTLTGAVLVDTTSAGGSTTGATVTFGSTLDGGSTLGLTAGTVGNVVFSELVGDTTALGAMTITSAANVTANGIRATSFTQTTGSGTTTLNSGDFTAGTDAALSVTGVGAVSIANGVVTLSGPVLSTAGGAGAVILNALTGALALGGTITSAGGATLTGATSLTQSAAILSTGVGANVAMTATTGTLTIGAGVGTAAGGAVTVNAAAGALTILAAGDINSGGVVNLTGGSGINTSGDVTTTADTVNYNSATTLTGGVLVNTTSGSAAGATVTFATTLNGAQSLGLTAGTAGNVVFTGLVGNTTPLRALTISSAANVTANGVRAASFAQTTGSGTTTLNLGDFTTGTDQAVGTTASGGISVSNDAVAVNGSLNTAAGGIVSLTGEVGALTIAALGDITSDGAVNLTAIGGISTAGDVTTTGDVINYNSAVTMSGPITLNSGGGNILFSSTLAGGNSDLTIAAGTAAGTTTFTGAVSGMGDGIGAAIAINSTGLAWFKNTVAGGSGIVSSPGVGLGSTRFDQNVTLTAGDTGSSFDGAVQFDGLSWSGFGGLTVSGPATLSTATLNITSNNGNVVFGSTLNGAQDLGLTAGTGSVSFNGVVGGSTPLGTVTVTSAAGVTAANNFSASTVTLTSVSGTASFAGNLVLTTGLNVSGGVNNVSMVGGGTIGATTTFSNTGTVTIGDAAGDSTTFTAGVIATAPTALNIAGTIAANTGASVITLGDAGTPVSVTATSVLGGSATGAISLGNVTLADGVTLTVGTGFTTTANLLAVSDGLNTGNLEVTANTMNFTGGAGSIAVGGTVLLQGQTAATTIGVAGAAGTLQVTGGNITAIADGATSITIGNSAQTGLVTVNAVGFVDPVVIRSSAVGGNVTVAGAITATDNASVTLQGDTLAVNAGVTTVGQNVLLEGGGVGVTLTGAPILTTATSGTGIDSGDITISAVGLGTINLDATSTLTTIGASNTIVGTNENGGAGGDVTITSETGSISTLALIDTSGGDASGGLAGCIGGVGGNVVIGTTAGSISLADITTSGGDAIAGASLNGGNAGTVAVSSSSGNTVTLNSSDINAIGGAGVGTGISGTGSDIVFNNPVLLAGGLTTITTTGSTGGDITFEAALDGTESLTLNAGTGSISFNGIVGATPLTTVTVNSASSTIANLAFSAGTVALIAPGTTSFNGNLNLTTALTTAAGAYNVSMTGAANTIAGATTFNNLGTLTIGQAGGTTTFTGGLVATAPSGVTLLGTVATANSTMTLGDAGTGVTLGAATTLNSGTGAINVNGALAGGGYGLTLQGGLGTGTVTIAGAISNLGSLTTTSAAYNVLVTGGGTIAGATSFLNTGAVTIGGAGLTTTFTGGLVATAPSGVTLLGTVATANSTMTLGDAGTGVTLGGTTTLKSGTGVININGALTGGVNGLTVQDATTGSTGAVNITAGIVSLGSLTTFGGSSNYAVSITGAANTIAGTTTFNNTGTLTLGDAAGDSNQFTAGVIATAPISKSIAGRISVLGTGAINLGTTPVTVTANATVGGTSTGAITLGNATIANGATLTVGAGIANAITMGTVSGVAGGTVSNLAINTTGAASVGVIGTDMGSVSATAENLTIADITTSGAITVTADGIIPTGITTSTAGGDITIRPLTAGTAIGIGTGAVSGGLDLGSGLADVFTSGRVIIGSTALTGSGSGAIKIGTVDLSETGYTGFSLLSKDAEATFIENSVLTLPTGTDIRFQLGSGNVNGLAELISDSLAPNLVSEGGTLRFVSVGSVSLYGSVANLQTSRSTGGSGGLVYLNDGTLNVIGNQTAAGEMLIGSVNGDLNLSSQLTGTEITAYAAQNFNNTFGSTAINLQGGRGLVYSTSPNDNTPNSANGGLNGFGAAYLVPTPNVDFGQVGTYTINNAPAGSANLMAYSDPLPVSQLDAVTLNEIVQTEAYLAAVPLTGATLPALPRSDVRLGFRAGAPQQRAPVINPLGKVEKGSDTKGQSADVATPGRLKVSQVKRAGEEKSAGETVRTEPKVQPVIRIGSVTLRPSGDYLPSELAEVTMSGIKISQK